MIGRIFLLLVVAGVGFMGYRIFGVFNEEKPVESVRELVPAKEKQVVQRQEPEVEREVDQEKEESDQVVILATASSWVLIEEWGIVHLGQEMPCGGSLRRIAGRLLHVWRDGKECFVKGANVGKLLAERTAKMVTETAAVLQNPAATAAAMPSLPSFFGESEDKQ
jgi:hypothetical protein